MKQNPHRDRSQQGEDRSSGVRAPEEPLRLQKFLARCAIGSRRFCETLIDAGRVSLNGETVTERGVCVDPQRDEVRVDGRPVRAHRKRLVLMLNKPDGCVTTRSDPRGDPTVYDLIPERWRLELFSIGRLDKNTEGLLLFTNDGELAYRLTHPKFSVDKTYELRLKGQFQRKDLQPLEKGIHLGDGPTAPARIGAFQATAEETCLALTIHEGRKRLIRRMCRKLGVPLRYLRRVQMGPIQLGHLARGKWRLLRAEEIRSLRTAAFRGNAPAK
jgi:pseudouridine synthase